MRGFFRSRGEIIFHVNCKGGKMPGDGRSLASGSLYPPEDVTQRKETVGPILF